MSLCEIRMAMKVLLFICIRLKETEKYVEEVKCPKCEMRMLVLDKIFEGIDIYDDRIESIGVRGI
jgi:hypothetical protein